MLIKAGSIIAVLIFSTYPITTNAQNRASGFENFKGEMMSQVGKKITVVGVLNPGKLGWWIAFQDWGVYIRAIKGPDIPKLNLLNRFEGHTVEVTGTLRYLPAPPPPKSDRVAEAIPPEHFYFDVAEARVISLRPPRSRRSKRSRGGKTSRLSTKPHNSFNRSGISSDVIVKLVARCSCLPPG